jgi:hypothetical protein
MTSVVELQPLAKANLSVQRKRKDLVPSLRVESWYFVVHKSGCRRASRNQWLVSIKYVTASLDANQRA